MRPALIGDWLGRRAVLSPSAPAIVDLADARTLDYATLERETNQVAHWLIAQGIGRGDRVARVDHDLGRARRAIIAKNQEYFYRWRPQNETYLFGFRKHEQGKNAAEVPLFDPIVEKLEKDIAEIRQELR